MAILSECPLCHKKQSIKNRLCSCGENLVNAKRAQRVRYWISYRLPEGKQRREAIVYSIEEARDAEGKRRSQKRENRIFDIKPDAKMNFRELTDWYLGLEKVKAKAYKDAGIPYGRLVKDGFVFHDLRHMFNTYMRKAGVAESVIMKITGDSTREIFDRYNSVDEDDIKGAVDQMRMFLKSGDQNVDQEKEKVLPGQD